MLTFSAQSALYSNVASLFAVWGDDGSWGLSIRGGFRLFNGSVIVSVPIDNVKRCRSVTSRGVFRDVPSGCKKVPVIGGSTLV